MPTPKFANLQAILAEESEPETGVVSERAEERLEAEMRRVLIDFFERFFLWCALFRPVSGSRGMRAETVLTRFGKVRVARRFVIGNGAEVNFPKHIFTVDCCHALGYVSKVCEFLARDAKEAKDVYRKTKNRKMRNSAPTAYCLTPHPFVRFFQTPDRSKMANGCYQKKSHP